MNNNQGQGIAILSIGRVKFINDEELARVLNLDLSFLLEEIRKYNEAIDFGAVGKKIFLHKEGAIITERRKWWFIPYRKKQVVKRKMYLIDYWDCDFLMIHLADTYATMYKPKAYMEAKNALVNTMRLVKKGLI